MKRSRRSRIIWRISSVVVIARSVSDEAIQNLFVRSTGLLRFARNDAAKALVPILTTALFLIRLEMRVGDPELRHRDLRGFAARDQIADDVIGFHRCPGLDVAEHRGRKWRAFRGQHATRALGERTCRGTA